MSEVKRYASDPCHSRFLTWVNVKHGGAELGDVVVAQDYDALAAQRDDGLAREQDLREKLHLVTEERDHAKRNCSAFEDRMGEFQSKHGKAREECQTLQQRLAEAETLLRSLESSWNDHSGRARHSETMNEVEDYFASPGCADGENS